MRHAPSPAARPAVGVLAVIGLVVSSAISESVLAAPTVGEPATSAIGHLVVSEVMTGGAGASDEFVELYNPSAASLSLDGLELVYVTASGATISRKAVWGAGAAIGPRAHVLVANEAGIFAGVADVTYANGLAATGGSMALRVVGAGSAVDAVGWGSAASTWLEGPPAPAAPAGSSLERLPGGPLGSSQDTDQNLVDFVVRTTPDPQNSGSPPVPTDPPSGDPSPSPSDVASPSPSTSPGPTDPPSPTPEPTPGQTATPIPSLTPQPTPEPTPTATPQPTVTPTPSAAPLTIAEARALPNDAPVVVRGTTLTDAAFSEGGGHLADATGGIAVLVDGGSFPRGVEVVIHGTVDDRFAQRTIRAGAVDIVVLGPGGEPTPLPVDSGAIDEAVEGRLVTLSGLVTGAPTSLTSGLAFEVDDGSGPVRVLVGPATAIDTTGWLPGSQLSVIGVVGQRDSSGTGSEGYRVQPRDSVDVLALLPPATPEPTPSPSPSTVPVSPTPAASPTPGAGLLLPIADARAAAAGTALRIRGVVTLPTGLVESGSAVVADASGAILVRSASDGLQLRRGQLVELTGTRSTRSGMASLRLSRPVTVLGTQAEPPAARRASGGVREADEAQLVVVRGVVRDGPRRTSGGGLTLTVNDGSGALRVFVANGTGITARSLPVGSWVEVRGVVGQQTTGGAPNAGYRLWPRDRSDVQVIAGATGAGGRGPGGATATARPAPTRSQTSPAAQPVLTRPQLGGAAALIATSGDPGATEATAAPPLPEIPVPLAAGIGGLAGLVTLAWRHGTWGRLQVEAAQRVVALRTGPHDEGDEESYTLAP